MEIDNLKREVLVKNYLTVYYNFGTHPSQYTKLLDTHVECG